jgi:Carboxypeptidase regulatory-like domain
MKSARVVLIALALLLIAGCNGAGFDGITGIGPTVSGTVVDNQNGAPISGATLTIGGRMGTSNINGGYFLAEVPKGAQTLKVTAPGYKEYTQELVIDQGVANNTVRLTK